MTSKGILALSKVFTRRSIALLRAATAYIDSSGLGALVTISKKVRESGGELRLAGLNSDLQSLFELTKLDTLFVISPSVADGLTSF